MFDFSKFCEIIRYKTQNMHFAKLHISILQENATVDFSNVLLKLYVFFMYTGVTFKFIPSLHFSVKNENLVQLHGSTISKFTYH